jgi:protein phosphatase
MGNKNNEDYSRYCQIVGATDVGCKRAANEDFLGQEDTINGRVAVVCDGMGGHVGGATASHIAVESVLAYLREHYHEDPRDAISESIIQANRAILAHAQAHPELTGMGSTCVLLIVRRGLVYIGHVGDSRIYLVRKRHIHQLTKDHSFVQMLVDEGQITKEQAEHHPRKNEITNALGIPNMQPPTVREEAIQPEAGDVFLLCSDGLSGMVSDDDICKTVSRIGELHAQQRADRLIEMARQNGGLDNITCELVEFSISPVAGKSGSCGVNGKKNLWIGLAALLLVLILAGGAIWWFSNTESESTQPESAPNQQQVTPPAQEPQKLQQEIALPEIKQGKKGESLYVIVFDEAFTSVKSKDEKKELYKLPAKCIPDAEHFQIGNKLEGSLSMDGKKAFLKLTETLKPGEVVSFSIGNDEYVFTFTTQVAGGTPAKKVTEKQTPEVTKPVLPAEAPKETKLEEPASGGEKPKTEAPKDGENASSDGNAEGAPAGEETPVNSEQQGQQAPETPAEQDNQTPEQQSESEQPKGTRTV